MTTTQPVLIEQRGEYQVRPFKAIAGKMWDKFFGLADSSNNLAHWMVDGYSSTVRLTGRDIDLNEYGPDWKISTPIIAIVDGFLESMEHGETVPSTAMVQRFRDWVETGILESFTLKRVQKKFVGKQFAVGGFAIVSSATDSGLAEDELILIWSNDKDLTPSTIKSRQLASQKGRKYAVRKKK